MHMLTRVLAALRSVIAFRMAIVTATTIAVAGFLSIHEYKARWGFLWNVMHGSIDITDKCISSRHNPFNDLIPSNCHDLLYRHVLLFAVLLVAVAAGLRFSGTCVRKR